ncbi:MAG: BON domain-containing protein [Taibaiella sp.]|jgi:osmotically-inducible protein OsmY
MKSDLQIQKDVIAEISWDPLLDAAEIGVSVKNGIVTLSGEINSYAKKLAAENAAKRVAGVKVVAEDIQVGMSLSYKKTDTEIAEAILNALKWNTAVQDEKIKIKVEDGDVKLEGEVEWEYQRANAKTAIANLSGVRSITNLIVVKPKVRASDIEQKISTAFLRNASLDANQIKVNVMGSKVTINGMVHSFAEKEAAATAAWSAPGVTEVENRLEIEIPEYLYED